MCDILKTCLPWFCATLYIELTQQSRFATDYDEVPVGTLVAVQDAMDDPECVAFTIARIKSVSGEDFLDRTYEVDVGQMKTKTKEAVYVYRSFSLC